MFDTADSWLVRFEVGVEVGIGVGVGDVYQNGLSPKKGGYI